MRGDDDVEGHSIRRSYTPGEGIHKAPKATGEGIHQSPKATGEEDTEGHWMPDAGSSMRLAKARNSDIEREARQHQLANEARQSRLDHDPKRTHQKG
jgi:hypothetical protein